MSKDAIRLENVKQEKPISNTDREPIPALLDIGQKGQASLVEVRKKVNEYKIMKNGYD